MLMIRLQRVGKKHEPVFRIVLTDSKNGPKSGKFLEILGHYDARRKEKAEVKIEKAKEWISKGAQLSNTIHNFFVERKIIEGKKINVLPKKSPIIKEVKEEEKKEATEEVKAPEIEAKSEEKEATSAESSSEPKKVAEEEAV